VLAVHLYETSVPIKKPPSPHVKSSAVKPSEEEIAEVGHEDDDRKNFVSCKSAPPKKCRYPLKLRLRRRISRLVEFIER